MTQNARRPTGPLRPLKEKTMTLQRRTLNLLLAGTLALAGAATFDAQAQGRKDNLILGMVLEPTPGLDPTTAAAAAIGEVVHYNILEGLTKINVDGTVTPLLAESWSMEPDGKSYTFKLRKGIKFQDGEPFDAAAVKFSFERAKAEGSTNKAKKAVFDNVSSIAAPDPHTVILVLNNADATLPFRLGENTAVILSPKSAATTATKPVGTGPYSFDSWQKGQSITLSKWAGYRNAGTVKINKVTFRFINDPAAQVAALLAGDIDGIPRFGALQSLKQFQGDKRFTVDIGDTAGKGILALNNKKAPLNDVRVRRAIMHAIDRKAFIDGVLEGLGKPIGSHFAPTDAGYVDLTKVYPYDPEKAKALLKEAGVATPLNLTLTLPPPQYARKERRMGAVAQRPVQGQLRPDHHQPRRAAGLHAVRQHRLLLGLRQQGLPRPGGQACGGRQRARAQRRLGRNAEEAGRGRGQRLHLQPGAGGGEQARTEWPVGQLADLRQ